MSGEYCLANSLLGKLQILVRLNRDFFMDFDMLKEKKALKVVKEDYNGYFCPLICKKTIIIIHY